MAKRGSIVDNTRASDRTSPARWRRWAGVHLLVTAIRYDNGGGDLSYPVAITVRRRPHVRGPASFCVSMVAIGRGPAVENAEDPTVHRSTR